MSEHGGIQESGMMTREVTGLCRAPVTFPEKRD